MSQRVTEAICPHGHEAMGVAIEQSVGGVECFSFPVDMSPGVPIEWRCPICAGPMTVTIDPEATAEVISFIHGPYGKHDGWAVP